MDSDKKDNELIKPKKPHELKELQDGENNEDEKVGDLLEPLKNNYDLNDIQKDINKIKIEENV